jgi:hypothetical protein
LSLGGSGLQHHLINDKEEVDLICKEQLEIKTVDLTLEQQIGVIVDEKIVQVVDLINKSNDNNKNMYAIIDTHLKNYWDRFKQQERDNKSMLDRLNQQVVLNRELIDKLNILSTMMNNINKT